MQTSERVQRLLAGFGARVTSIEELDSNRQYPLQVRAEFTVSDVGLSWSPKNENRHEHLSLPIPVHPVRLTLYKVSCVVHLYQDYAIISNLAVSRGYSQTIYDVMLRRNAFYTIAEKKSVVIFDGVKLPDIVQGLEGKYMSLVFDTRIGYLPTFMVDNCNLRFVRPVFIPLPTRDLVKAIIHANREHNACTDNGSLKKFLKEKLPEYKDRMPEELRALVRWSVKNSKPAK